MAFFEDPRLRQRWNQISHNAGEVTENAAAGIWSFQHHYLNPCLISLSAWLEQCTAPCLGDREERARRRRERERARGRAEYSFDFYDDWHADDELEDGGILGGWDEEHWDRLLAGSGSQRRHGVEQVHQEQPKRKGGMSYGTRGSRRKSAEHDPTIIPSTQPIGFLGRLPWKMGKTLRYKPSAADLQDHPHQHDIHDMGEREPLLGDDADEDEYYFHSGVGAGHDGSRAVGVPVKGRKRSGTTGSGDTSDSYRSRGDLFPSDGEGEEDAVPLDDEFTMVLDKVGGGGDDRSSGKTRSSKGKRPAGGGMSRTVSRATMDSVMSRGSKAMSRRRSSGSIPSTPEMESLPSMGDLQAEEDRLRKEEEAAETKRKRREAPAAEFAGRDRENAVQAEEDKEALREGGFFMLPEQGERRTLEGTASPKWRSSSDEDIDEVPHATERQSQATEQPLTPSSAHQSNTDEEDNFIPARLPNFR